MDRLTDRELLRDYARSRDGDSLGVFLSRHQDSLLRFTERLLRDHEAAQDVVQETFLRVARDPGRILKVENHQVWLLKVARNIGISHLRRLSVARRHADELGRRLAGAARNGDGRDALEAEETRDEVRAQVDRLTPRHREVLLLKVQEGKSYREIAAITGLSVTNVGYLLHHAMKGLARRLSQRKEGPP